MNKNYNVFSKTKDTFDDLMKQIIIGGAKSLEGIRNKALESIGTVGGMFDTSLKYRMQMKIQENTGIDSMINYIQSPQPFDPFHSMRNPSLISKIDQSIRNTDGSYVNQMSDRGQRIVRGTAEGVGGMLPMIATGQALGALGFSMKVAQGVSQAVLFAGAAGQATEEALNEGAKFEQASMYGNLNGLTELITERIFGGGSVLSKTIGKGALDNIIAKVATKPIFKAAMNVAGEGFEEAVAELFDPLWKRATYDKSAEFLTEKHLEQIAESAIIGSLTSIALGSAYVNTVDSLATDINVLSKKESKQFGRGIDASNTSKSVDEVLTKMSKKLVKMDENKRKETLKQYKLENYFKEDGTVEVANEGGVNTLAKRGKLPSAPNGKPLVVSKKITVEQERVLQIGSRMNKRVVFADNVAKGYNAFFDPNTNTIVINSKAKNPYIAYAHELTHNIETLGDREYNEYSKFIRKEVENNPQVQKMLDERGIKIDKILKKYDGQAATAQGQEWVNRTEVLAHITETVFGSEASLNRLADMTESKKTLKKVYDWAKKMVAEMGKDKEMTPEEKSYFDILKKAEKKFAKAIENAESGVKVSDIDKAATENKRYSIAYLRKEQIRKALAGELLSKNSVFLDFTPEFLHNIGLKNYRLTITQNHLKNIIASPKESNNKKHAIPLSYIEDVLIKDLGNPTMAIKTGKNRVIIVSENLDVDGSPIIIPIKINAVSYVNEIMIEANHILSIYGRDGFAEFIDRNKSNIMYANKEKTNDLFSRIAHTRPNFLDTLVYDTILQQVDNNVNEDTEINSDVNDQRFSIETNDKGEKLTPPQKIFFNNSKAVDKDGNLLKLYHGTKADFTVFRKSDRGYHGDGIYLTNDQDTIDYYSKDGIKMELYAKIENPYIGSPRLDKAWDESKGDNGIRGERISELLMQRGHDGIIVENANGSYTVVAFNPHQVKSTTNINPSSHVDIRYMLVGEGSDKVRFPRTIRISLTDVVRKLAKWDSTLKMVAENFKNESYVVAWKNIENMLQEKYQTEDAWKAHEMFQNEYELNPDDINDFIQRIKSYGETGRYDVNIEGFESLLVKYEFLDAEALGSRLIAAEKMHEKQVKEGKLNIDEIVFETGWLLSKDNNWKYRIDTSDTKFNTKKIRENLEYWHENNTLSAQKMKLSEVMQSPNLYSHYPILENIYVYFSSELANAYGMWDGRNITIYTYKTFLSLNEDGKKADIKALENIIKYAEVAISYLKDNSEIVNPRTGNVSADLLIRNARAIYSVVDSAQMIDVLNEMLERRKNELVNKKSLLSNPDKEMSALEDTIVHEVQHIIQDYERWAQGGNLDVGYKLIAAKLFIEANEEANKKGLVDQYEIDAFVTDYIEKRKRDASYEAYLNLLGEHEARLASKDKLNSARLYDEPYYEKKSYAIDERGNMIQDQRNDSNRYRYSISDESLMSKYPNIDLNQDISSMDGVPAIELIDGSVIPAINQPTHVSFIKANGIDATDIASGGWIGNGVYEPTQSSDAMKYVQQQMAKKRMAEKRLAKAEDSVDSKGNPLSKEQERFFKDSEARDKNGNLMVMYHGSPFNKFYTFKGDMMFFSKSKKFAEDYAQEKSFDQSMDADVFVHEVYLNIKKMFHSRNETQVRELISKIDVENMTLGFANRKYDQETWVNTIMGKRTMPPSWSKEQIKKASFGKIIGDDIYGYNNDVFVGIDKDDNVVVVSGYNSSYLKYATEDQIKTLLDGKPITIRVVDRRFNKEDYIKAYGYAPSEWEFENYTVSPYKHTQKTTQLENQDNWVNLELTYDSNTKKSIIDYIRDEGYDGIEMYENGVENYVAFNPNQIKLTSNIKPTIKRDIRFSKEQDADGQYLTTEQAEYFKDSKARDADGKLLVMYHGSTSYFNEFSKEMIKNRSYNGFMFTSSEKYANKFASDRSKFDDGKDIYVKKVYLNLKNPMILNKNNADDIIREYYVKEKGYRKNAKITSLLTDLYLKNAQKRGHDGIILEGFQFDYIDQTWMIAFEPEQIKLTSNLNPSVDPDIRYSKEKDTYTKGEVKKIVARFTKDKTYSKADAEMIVNTIMNEYMVFEQYDGNIGNKTRQEVVQEMWEALNSLDEGERGGAAIDIANYIIENAVAEDVYADEMNKVDAEYVAAVSVFKHQIDLSTIKADIRNTYGKNNTPFLMWGVRKGKKSINMGDVVQELAESGIQIDGNTEAEQFVNFMNRYEQAKDNLKTDAKSLKSELSKQEMIDLKNNIVREILNSWEKYGKATPINKEISKYQGILKDMKSRLRDAKEMSFAVSRLFKTIDRVSALEKYQSVEEIPLSKEIVLAVKLLRGIKTWRGNLASANTVREIFKKYMTDVDDGSGKKLPLFELYHKLENANTFGLNPYGDLIKDLANGQGALTIDDFNAIDMVLTNFIHNVKSYDRVFFQSKEQSLTELVDRAVGETQNMIPVKDSTLNSYKYWNLSSVWIFERLSNFKKNGYFSQLFRELHEGIKKQSLFKQRTANHYKAFFEKHRKEVDGWRTPSVEIDGVKVSKGQLISLYLLSKRNQALSHLFNIDEKSGTVRISDEGLAKKHLFKDADRQGTDVSITLDQINGFKFTTAEMEFITLTQAFFNKIARDAKVETDVALFGVTNVADEEYYPIRVSNDVLVKNIGDASVEYQDLFSVYNASFNKNVRRNARNKVLIENVLDVIERHTQQMSAYYGLAIPIKNFNKVMNKKTDKNDHLFGHVYKKAPFFERYINKLLKDIQGVRPETSTFDRILGKVRGWWARAALGLNPKVWATQFASLISAEGVGIKAKHLMKGMAQAIKNKTDYDTLYEYSPMLYDRAREGNNIDVGLLKQDLGVLGKLDALTNLTTQPIGIIDRIVVGAIWNAALEQTKGNHTPNSKEHYQAAASLVEEAVIRTQANWSPLYRPAILREHSSALSMVTMFMSEPLQIFSQIAGSIEKVKIARELNDTAMIKEASNDARRYAIAISQNAMYLVMISMLFRWIKFGEDDDETILMQALEELSAHFIGMFPIARDLFSLAQGYDLTNMYQTGITNIYYGLQSVWNMGSGLLSDQKPYDAKDFSKDFRQLFLGITQTLGIPLKNFETYTTGVIEKFDQDLIYRYRDNFRSQSYTSDLTKAIENDDDDMADTIIDLMLQDRSVSVSEQSVNNEITRLYKQGHNVIPKSVPKTLMIDDENVKLNKRQYKAFKTVYDQADTDVAKMIKSPLYMNMNENARARAIRFIYDYYYNLAKQDLTGEDEIGKLGLIAKTLPIYQIASLYSTFSNLEADKTSGGQVVSGSRKAKMVVVMQQQRVPKTVQSLLLAYFGYSIDDGNAIKAYMQQYQLSADDTKLLMSMIQ